jgi:hypothetical protein
MDDEEQRIDDQILKLVDLIERKYVSSEEQVRPMDLARASKYLLEDVTSSVAFGEPFGYLEADNDLYGVIEISEALFGPVSIAALFPSVVAITSSPLMKPFLPKTTDMYGIGRLLGIVKSHVDARYGPYKVKKNDALQAFVDSGLPRNNVEVESLIQLIGGSDSTATAVRNIIFYVSTNKLAYKKLQDEIDEATKVVKSPILTDQEARNLPYLQATIKEGLRMWPPISGLAPHMSDHDETVCGVRIPAKTNVAWGPASILKDKATFGQDAAIFNPDRWIGVKPDHLKTMDAVYGMVFMSGTRWECLGKRSANIVLGKTIFEVCIPATISSSSPAICRSIVDNVNLSRCSVAMTSP